MPDAKTRSDDKQKVRTRADDKKAPPAAVVPKPLRERESSEAQAESFAKIQEIGREAEITAEREVKRALGEEARLAQAEPKIGPDLEDHGVKSPQAEASNVLKKGSVIELPITQEEFKQAEKAKFSAHVDEKWDVLGVSGVIALAMWIGRILKMAHNHAMKIVFRKPSSAKATEGEGGERSV